MPKDLSESECARFQQRIRKACEEIYASNKQVLQQRIQQADSDVLKTAVQMGMAAFQQAVKALPTDCSDPAVTKKLCLVSSSRAWLVTGARKVSTAVLQGSINGPVTFP
jgi:hypothetical protein